jgi:hypothetical protein
VRSLIYIPIIHSEADLGTLADEVHRQFQAAVDTAEAWEWHAVAVEAMWNGIRTKLLALSLDWPRTRLYQDGLPVCGQESQIVRELAAKGSRNHQLLLELQERGAILMGTDDPELVVTEYRRILRLVQAAREGASEAVLRGLKREGEVILRERDAYIAHRIDTTLREGETGLLFVGLLHGVDKLLGAGFEVRHVIHNLPFDADLWRQLKEQQDHGH